jgi:hypothetical protein
MFARGLNIVLHRTILRKISREFQGNKGRSPLSYISGSSFVVQIPPLLVMWMISEVVATLYGLSDPISIENNIKVP